MFTGERIREQVIHLDVHPSLVMLLKGTQVEQERTESLNKLLFSQNFATGSLKYSTNPDLLIQLC